MKTRPRFNSLSTIILLIGLLSAAQTNASGLKQIETEHMRLIYFGGAPEFLSPHVGRCFENAYRYHTKFWDYEPSEKVTVIMYDAGDYGNAGALATPTNRVLFMIAPLSTAYETSPVNERVNTIMNHELTHVVALDKAAGSEKFFRGLFAGKVVAKADNPLSILYSHLTSPRRSSPRWYHEGIAVFMETWMAGGYGRAMGSFDEMVFRTLVMDGGRIYDPVGVESEGIHVDFQVGVNSYLYGTRFMSYLALTYGPETVIDWVSRTDGSKSYYSSQFKNVYGASLDSKWEEWIDWEREFQRENLDSIRQYALTEYKDISQQALGSMSGAQYYPKTNTLYTAVNYPGRAPHIAAIDVTSGSVKAIKDIKGAALYFVSSLALDTANGTLFYTIDNNDWRDLKALDLNTGKSKMLIKDVRAGDLAFSHADSTLWGVRHFNGLSTLTRFLPPYDEWDQVYTLPYGKDMYDLSISPDGATLCAGMSEVNGRQRLVSVPLESILRGDTAFTTVFDFGNSVPANFKYGADGRYLYGSSYYTGVSNIFRYDFTLDSMEALSNAESGFFQPLPVNNDSLIIFRYTSDGFKPAKIKQQPLEDVSAIQFLGQKIVESHPVVTEWIAPGPGSINLDSISIDTGYYNALSHMALNSMYPIVEGYKDYPAYGMRFNIAEPLSTHRSDLSVTYTPNQAVPKDERAHVRWNYGYMNWGLHVTHNSADFYDLFGPTKTSRKGQSIGISYKRSLIDDGPKRLGYSLRLTGYQNQRRLPDYQNVATTFDKFISGSLALNYSNKKFSLGAVDYEKGVAWGLVTSGRLVNRRAFPRANMTLDLGAALPWKHATIWLRNSAGYAYGERDNPFANYYFGGFGNNWVDHRSSQRYRAYYAFPGVELNEIGGKNYARTMLDLSLPPLRFRRLGAGSFYVTWAKLALFATGAVTNLDREDLRRYYGNLGAQIDFRITFLSYLRTTVSAGYALAYERDHKNTNEFMFSVKIL